MNCKCEFCADLRNIQPAKYIKGWDKESKETITRWHNNKKFVMIIREDEGIWFEKIDKCPVCGYRFTKEDYNGYY